jgi:hypothetical protein
MPGAERLGIQLANPGGSVLPHRDKTRGPELAKMLRNRRPARAKVRRDLADR